jgi:hypothetical protein
MSIMSANLYISRRVSDRACEGERFGGDGLPVRCEDTPVFELLHSNGRALHICEYHIQFYWNAWPPFRNAVRDIWPVVKIGTR